MLSDATMEVAFGQAETLVDDAELTIGGSGAIMACAAARLGLRTALAGLVGPDQFGEFMLRAVSERGVDVSGVVVSDEVRTGLTVVLTRPGDRAILTFPGAIARDDRRTASTRGLLGRARHVHVSSFFLQTASGARAGDAAELRAGRRGDDVRGPQLGSRPRTGTEACTVCCRTSTCCSPTRWRPAGWRASTTRRSRQRGWPSSRPLVAVKLGAEGAVAAPAGGAGELVRALPPQRVVDPVDAVGAGDAFDAGLLCALLDGRPLDCALAFACACGTLSMRAAGGTAAQATLAEARAVSRQA